LFANKKLGKSGEKMNYSIHNILKIRTNVRIPVPDHFRTQKRSRNLDLTILSKNNLNFEKPRNNGILRGNYYFWADDDKLFVDYGFMNAKLSIENLFGNTKVECTNSLKRFCTNENWQQLIFAILSVKLIQKGHTFVHAGCLSHRGEGILIAAMQDTGKTSTVLSLLDGEEFRFLGDDFVILNERGTLYSYPKEVRVSPRTLRGAVFGGSARDNILKYRIMSTLVERFVRKDITKLLKVPEKFVDNKCPAKKIFVLKGFGKDEATVLNKRSAFSLLTTLSLQMPNLLETYLDMYYHIFNVDVLGLIHRKNKIIEKAVKVADCYAVTAQNLEGYSKVIKKISRK